MNKQSIVSTRGNPVALWFGPLAALALLAGVIGLAQLVPGYSSVRQTVSEIGEMGSPARVPFAAMTCAVALCLLVFGRAVTTFAAEQRLSKWPGYLIVFMALPVAGTGIFAFPHPLHNVFGISELIAYPAPLVLALLWRGRPDVRQAVVISAIGAAFVLVALAINLGALPPDGWVRGHVRSYFGLVQRFLFATWFAWVTVLGMVLLRSRAAQSPLRV